jgi:hypothetical protein
MLAIFSGAVGRIFVADAAVRASIVPSSLPQG